MNKVDTREPETGRESHRPGLYLRLAAGVALAGALVLAVALASRFGVDPTLVASPLIGEPAPDVVLPRLDSESELDLAEFRG